MIDSPEKEGSELATPELVDEIKKNIEELRCEQRGRAMRVLEDEPAMNDKTTGDVFVEKVGTIVHMENGDFQHIYNAHAISARDAMLASSVRDRRKMFEAIGAQFEPGSRVLNIGAGGDTVPINAFKLAGHDVINTDFSQDAVDVLAQRTSAPVFAVDLINLDKVMPGNSVDYLTGNSTLGYVEPNKLKKVVDNLCRVMKKGGVFTFDLNPHPSYSQIFENKDQQTVVNESETDPVKLLEFVQKYGPVHGMNAMGVHQFYRSEAIMLAVIDKLRELFEAKGFMVSTGIYSSNIKDYLRSHILRVEREGNEKSVLVPVNGEVPYADAEEVWDVLCEEDDIKAFFRLFCIDRQNAALLAREFGLSGDNKALPYIVSEHVARNQGKEKLPKEIRDDVVGSIHPALIRDAIQPYLDGEKIRTPRPLSGAVQTDQIMHKFFLSGQSDYTREQIEFIIDREYAKEHDSKSSAKAGKPIMKSSGFKGKKKTGKKNRRG